MNSLAKRAARQGFIAGSDARILMGDDEAGLIRLWREKRGEAEPEGLSGNLIVVTEALNRLVATGDVESGARAKKTWRRYFRFRCRGFRSRRPSPPPFSSMNSIPARSKAASIASTAPGESCRRSFSKSTTVESPRPAASASCDCVISSNPRAARHWAGVI
jgi:hypothetical protein